MKSLLLFCFTVLIATSVIFVISERSVSAQEIDELVAIYSEPQILVGDSKRCQIDDAVANGGQMTIGLPNANVASQGLGRDFLECQIEMNVTLQPKAGWYVHSIEHTIVGGLVNSLPEAKAAVSVQSKFQRRTVLQFREGKNKGNEGKISRSNSILASSAWSKQKQCSGALKSVTGKITLSFKALTKGNAHASVDTFDVSPIPAQCSL